MELKASKRIRPFYQLTLRELLDRLRVTEPPESVDSDMHREFYYRFARQLYKTCLVVCGNSKLDQKAAEDVFQESMIKALKKINKFTTDTKDPEAVISKRIMGWLNIIAEHQVIDFLRKNCKDDELDEATTEDIVDETLVDNFNEQTHIAVSLERLRLQKAMESLSDRERYLIMVFASYGCLNLKRTVQDAVEVKKGAEVTKEVHLPDEVLDQVCKDLGIKKGNIRAIKRRALDKLFTALSVE